MRRGRALRAGGALLAAAPFAHLLLQQGRPPLLPPQQEAPAAVPGPEGGSPPGRAPAAAAAGALSQLPLCPAAAPVPASAPPRPDGPPPLLFRGSDVRVVLPGAAATHAERSRTARGTDGLRPRSGGPDGERSAGARGVLVGCGSFDPLRAAVVLPPPPRPGLPARLTEKILDRWEAVSDGSAAQDSDQELCGNETLENRAVVAAVGSWRLPQHAANPNHCLHELLWPLAHACGGELRCAAAVFSVDMLAALASAAACLQLLGLLLRELRLCAVDSADPAQVRQLRRRRRPLLLVRSALPGAGGGRGRHPRCAAHTDGGTLDTVRHAGLRLLRRRPSRGLRQRTAVLLPGARRRVLFYSRRGLRPQRGAAGRRAIADLDSWELLKARAAALGAEVVDALELAGAAARQLRLIASLDMAVWVAGGHEAWTLWAPPHLRVLQWEPCAVHEPVSWLQWWCPFAASHCLRTLVASSCEAASAADVAASGGCVEPRWMDLRINGTLPEALAATEAWLTQRDWGRPPLPGGECRGDSSNVVRDWRRRFCSPSGAAAALEGLRRPRGAPR